MKEGVRSFINFTNDWKGRLQDTALYFRAAEPIPIAEIPERILRKTGKKVSAARLADDTAEAKEYVPKLPAPEKEAPSTKQIRFNKPTGQISEIGRALFSNGDEKPAVVGEACFDQVLREIRKSKKKA